LFFLTGIPQHSEQHLLSGGYDHGILLLAGIPGLIVWYVFLSTYGCVSKAQADFYSSALDAVSEHRPRGDPVPTECEAAWLRRAGKSVSRLTITRLSLLFDLFGSSIPPSLALCSFLSSPPLSAQYMLPPLRYRAVWRTTPVAVKRINPQFQLPQEELKTFEHELSMYRRFNSP
jgi:hypothetical protein